MTVTLSVDLLLYGLMIGGLNIVAHRIAPDFAGVMPTFTVAGGLLIAVWGLLGLGGFRRRGGPIVTLGVVLVLLLVQTVEAWIALKAGDERLKPVALIHSLLVFYAIGQIVNLARTERQSRIGLAKDMRGEAGDIGAKAQPQRRTQSALDE